MLKLLLFARHSRECGNPATSSVLARKALDSRVRGNDEQKSKNPKREQDQTPKASAMERRVTFFVQ
ncbi:hypothetical protein J7J50_08260, partial [Lysobacter sp. ISL-50]|nr:hypothetical protein [Lysobacter sp. ISL-50]